MSVAFKFMVELYSREGKLSQETVKSEYEKMATYGKCVKLSYEHRRSTRLKRRHLTFSNTANKFT